MDTFWRIAICTLALASCVNSEGIYTVVAPKVVRPDLDYHVGVSTHGVQDSVTMMVAVEGVQAGGGSLRNSQEVTVLPETTSIIKLQMGNVGPGSYNLTVKGIRGMIFENSTELEYVHKSYSVFVQTDKAIYKPGQTVQFRVIMVNPYLRPSVTGAMDVFVTDGKGNRVKQWNRVFTHKGVFASELHLSNEPVLGDWTLTVNVLGQTFTKSFEVAEYVLPKFEVTIDLPPYATFQDPKIVATIRAKYTYGKPVKGEATLAVYPNYHSLYIQPVFSEPFRKVLPLDGKATVEIDLVKDLRLATDFHRPVTFDVFVKEALTGRRQNVSATLIVHKYPYKFEFIKTTDNFKPGLKYTAFLKVAYQDDKPVQDEKNMVVVKHGFSYTLEEYNSTQYRIPKNGLIELEFYPPLDENVHGFGVEATYLELNQWLSHIERAHSPSNTYIQAVLKTAVPTVNREVEIQVNSTVPLNKYTFHVVGRGDVQLARTVDVGGRMTSSFSFLALGSMAPRARVVVFHVRKDGEVVADALDFDVQGAFQNFVDVNVKPGQAEPGQEVQVDISSKPGSYVGVLGIDQSVLLLKSGNDITQADVLEELESYDGGRRPDYLPWMRGIEKRKRRSLVYWSGSSTAGEVFQNAGVVVLTNAFVYEHYPFGVFPPLKRNPWEDNPLRQKKPGEAPIPAPVVPLIRPDLTPRPGPRPSTRPPLAGPYAFSRLPVPTYNNRRVFLLRDLPPTWLFENVTIRYDGHATITKKAPDTITSWVISAFALDNQHGLGVMESPTKMQVFRPFFVSLNLPYSVIRGEVVAIQAVVFNYMKKDVTAQVTLENANEEFEFTEMSNEVDRQSRRSESSMKSVLVKAGDGASVSFMITPKVIGHIDIKVTATSSLAGDAVLRQLRVKSEGQPQHVNKAVLVDLRNSRSFSSSVPVEIPPNAVPGSSRVEVAVAGDLLGPAVNNLDSLLRMPFGCGEQNMLNFVPNIVVTEYLQKTRQLTPAIRAKSLRFMETGYQRELTYRRNDGSFSAFGQSDPNGSTWLTAFVARSFYQARPHLSIDPAVLEGALEWLSRQQAANGSFPEVGKVSHTDMQGGAAKGLALTAYTLIAFLQSREIATPALTAARNRATDYLVRQLDGLEDPYAIALVAYALQLAQHPASLGAFNLLEDKANVTADGEMKWWSKRISAEEKESNPWHSLTKSVDVEMTSYALLTYVERDLISDALPIMRWLVAQRNAQGGFSSTQDTVVGIYALAKLAERMGSGTSSMKVRLGYGGSSREVEVTRDNAMVLQKFELPADTKTVEVEAQGSGFAVVQVESIYNLAVVGAWPLFSLDPQLDKSADQNQMKVTVCTHFIGGDGGNQSNMAVMEVDLPSGYTVDQDSLPSLRNSHPDIKRVDTQEGDTQVVLYFDQLTRREICPTVSAYRTFQVAKQKPVPVVVYDYYDNSRRARAFYEPVKATLCDICEGSECSEECRTRPRGQTGGEGEGEGGSRTDGGPITDGGGGGSSTLQPILPALLCLLGAALVSALGSL